MKIIHTSDWHIGKKLYKYELRREHELFFEQLTSYIEINKVDLLLVSGDVFDMANPSSDARKLYYETLVKLMKTGCRVIITGGNHDSPAVLNAPKEILRALNIDVVGSKTEKLEDMIFPVQNKFGETEAVVAAIPYLRDSELRKFSSGQTHEEKISEVNNGIKQVFTQSAELCREKYPGIPAIATGHIFLSGSETSDSEREIQIGAVDAFSADMLPGYFDYYALGHIHKPKFFSRVNAAYSGSPIPLSFSEKEDRKLMKLIDTGNGTLNISDIKLPSFRKLVYINGSFEKIKDELKNFSNEGSLPALAEVELTGDNISSATITEFEDLISDFDDEEIEIVKHRITDKSQKALAGDLFGDKTDLNELSPVDIFNKKLDSEELNEEDRELAVDAFNEILEEILREG